MSSPIFLNDLFPKLDEKLIEVLRSLSKEDWERQTIAPLWKVKDVAAHLLDGNIRTLSMLKDGYFGDSPGEISSYQDLLSYLNRLNAEWVKAMKRVSPAILTDMLEATGKEYHQFLTTLNPFADAAFSVAWAGEDVSQNWFHIAREYTEKWHHQQQIRLAVDLDHELYTRELYHPHLETSMRALPHHYRNVEGKAGETIQFSISTEGGGDWFLSHNGQAWALTGNSENIISKVNIKGEIAWRIFTKGISRAEAEKQTGIEGDPRGSRILDMLAVMA
ncbi:hypothetical protein GVN16_24545 [Emticicia sp. CRIBPO]|uniref:maleylpyruvate isomerase N-terminal domain-containing protein n=1 Tax=Emticicia sp. CRIBPO TaxID=2683258 RepID=UPI0014124FAC|nr:maleylpyruvate isomerase N-terminal domain-containing protein [Emticicia sp. CRIBPO]NBA88968.1 hypothetical protein [Emticicia sp. CRIBPO]